MSHWVIAPLLLTIFSGILSTTLVEFPRLQMRLSFIIGLIGLIVSGILFQETYSNGVLIGILGSWPPPFGIVLVSDFLSAIMVFLTSLLSLTGLFISHAYFGTRRHPWFLPSYHFLILGVLGSFLTGDLFNLYVWFEVFLIASFLLASISMERKALSGLTHYVAINIFSSMIFLFALGTLYNASGTLNIAELASLVRSERDALSPLFAVSGLLFLFSFGVKSAIFPLYFWLPSSYPHLPAPIVAIFAGLLTKVGVYAIIRTFGLVYGAEMSSEGFDSVGWALPTLGVISAFTMVLGVVGAAAQMDIKKILSVHIVSQVGYMTLAISFFGVHGITAAIFFLIHQIPVKTNLFYCSAVIEKLSGTDKLSLLGSLRKNYPWLALGFAVSALSLAGIPPLSGFWAKFLVLSAGVLEEKWLLTLTALLVSLLTLFSMVKIWNEAFQKKQEHSDRPFKKLTSCETWQFGIGVGGLLVWILFMSYHIEFFYNYSTFAAEQILGDHYIKAVLGGEK